jgi:LmbE family N-acetylglucosaminyl deacetylase
VYLPLGVGGHVDHRLCRQVGIDLLKLGQRWVMPGPEYAGTVVFYEDFPYALWNDFRTLDQLGPDAFADLPAEVSVYPAFADITDQIERKITGISIYESQVERLFDGSRQMGDAVRSYGAALASVGDVDGQAERYWRTSRV